MNTLIMEPDSKVDYQIFVSLAKRLNVTFREEKAEAKKEKVLLAEAKLLKKQKEDAFFALAGSFEGLDADKMIKDIEESRTSKEMDPSWID